MEQKDLLEILDYFPEVELPVSLSPDSITEISRTNKPLPTRLQSVIMAHWETDIDDLGEVIPCFQLPLEKDYFTLIYWRANVLSHEYIIATVDRLERNIISRKVIAGIITDGERVIQSVANLQEDKIIHIMAGETKNQTTDYDPLTSSAFFMEILPGGEIYSQKEDQPLAWVERRNTEND